MMGVSSLARSRGAVPVPGAVRQCPDDVGGRPERPGTRGRRRTRRRLSRSNEARPLRARIDATSRCAGPREAVTVREDADRVRILPPCPPWPKAMCAHGPTDAEGAASCAFPFDIADRQTQRRAQDIRVVLEPCGELQRLVRPDAAGDSRSNFRCRRSTLLGGSEASMARRYRLFLLLCERCGRGRARRRAGHPRRRAEARESRRTRSDAEARSVACWLTPQVLVGSCTTQTDTARSRLVFPQPRIQLSAASYKYRALLDT
jgi:hypothetical protein